MPRSPPPPSAATAGRRHRRQRIEHEEADEPRGVPADRGGDGLLVARNARNQGDARDTMTIQLRDPAVGKLLNGSGIVPADAVRYCGGAPRLRQVGDPL